MTGRPRRRRKPGSGRPVKRPLREATVRDSVNGPVAPMPTGPQGPDCCLSGGDCGLNLSVPRALLSATTERLHDAGVHCGGGAGQPKRLARENPAFWPSHRTQAIPRGQRLSVRYLQHWLTLSHEQRLSQLPTSPSWFSLVSLDSSRWSCRTRSRCDIQSSFFGVQSMAFLQETPAMSRGHGGARQQVRICRTGVLSERRSADSSG